MEGMFVFLEKGVNLILQMFKLYEFSVFNI